MSSGIHYMNMTCYETYNMSNDMNYRSGRASQVRGVHVGVRVQQLRDDLPSSKKSHSPSPPRLPSDLRPNLRGRRSKPLTDGYSSKGGAVGGGCAVDWGSVIQ